MRDEAGVRSPVLPDLLRPGLRIVFCGVRATAADNLRLSDTKMTQAIIDVSLYVG
jgi:hypothetical protein